ncbi:branched-chain amino acid transport system II carrier protein [Pseudalkalibacillus salsuginis]|uniref:branched-chain amino acid transport system II carrier protein n=1 Tax=Pseudalkalibacillus salsuginis TaxID=2910972 RepID=UPI001F293A31|nr:branched-chain amino acid transport system II carrier protein [Pseudalkalibacillus salsuginis]MCF6408783.1 branched-chain amino acid transport system II carrier protein [Pseudalkalibacillus salsuginis]
MKATKSLPFKETLTIGLMMFALFLGAGNMIFPPLLGQTAGTNVWTAIFGFLITGAGLPLVGIVAVGLTGGTLKDLASRVHPAFAIIFSTLIYLAIGPFFGIPRTGTVAFEIGAVPFLPETMNPNGLPLFIYTVIFFTITFWVALNPTKLVDRIGKILTPILIFVIGLIVIKGIINPIGNFSTPTGEYASNSFFTGFINGYLTMDAIAALVFGIVVINAVKSRGVTDKKEIAKATTKAGFIAVSGLALVYLSLAYIGATSRNVLGESDNGGAILTGAADLLFGQFGIMLLAIAITFACLTTSIGLVTACGEYFNGIMPKVSYKLIIAVLCLFSAAVANVGLTQLINLTLPVLIGIYPLAIALVAYSFLHRHFGGYREVYIGGLLGAGVVSIFDALKQMNVDITVFNNVMSAYLPLYEQGVGWVIPSLIGAIIGYVIGRSQNHVITPNKA